MNKFPFILLFLVLFPFYYAHGIWLGYDVYRCGAKGLAVGGAFTAIADDVSAVYYNPAGLVQVKAFSIFYTMDSQIRIANVSPELKLTYKVPALIGLTVPFQDSKKTVFTFAVYSPFQRKIPTEFAVYKFAPTLSLELLPGLAVGGNIGLMLAIFDEAHSPYGFGINGQAGILYSPWPELHFGLNYNSPFTIKWNRHFEYSDVKETFPDIISIGAAGLVSKRVVLAFDLEYQNWNRIKLLEGENDMAPSDKIEDGLFKTIHPHIGAMFLEEKSGAHLRTGFYTDSFIENVDNKFQNNTQVIWTIGIGAYAFKIVKIEAALADTYLMHFLFDDNNRVETIQVTVEYRFE